MPSQLFRNALKKVPRDTKIFVGKSMDIVERIYEIMEAKNINQKDLAKLLGKSPSEINKWLTGSHNLTLKTIAKLEAVLEDDIILVVSAPKKEVEVPTHRIQITFVVKKIADYGLVMDDTPTNPSLMPSFIHSNQVKFVPNELPHTFLATVPNFAFSAQKQAIFIKNTKEEHEPTAF